MTRTKQHEPRGAENGGFGGFRPPANPLEPPPPHPQTMTPPSDPPANPLETPPPPHLLSPPSPQRSGTRRSRKKCRCACAHLQYFVRSTYEGTDVTYFGPPQEREAECVCSPIYTLTTTLQRSLQTPQWHPAVLDHVALDTLVHPLSLARVTGHAIA